MATNESCSARLAYVLQMMAVAYEFGYEDGAHDTRLYLPPGPNLFGPERFPQAYRWRVNGH